ncbi:MAG: tetratricopeptide repeat protein [Pyrinomonadaceae bacterium]
MRQDSEIAKLLIAAQNRRLVIFVGAGVSVAPPTNLPAWRDVNRIVVRSLASAATPVLGQQQADNAADLILSRHAHEKLPPEYQAQVLAELLHKRYFEVLRYLDSEHANPNHLAIAWLARLGCVRAIITTNFDRVIETAFAAVDAPLERHFQPDHFHALAADLARFDKPDLPCQLLKLHGSVDDPGTLIDTLAQRKRGFPLPVMTCVQHLLRSGHWLFLGFSGLDLEAESNYLNLLPEAETAQGFTWFVREKSKPLPAVINLKERYGDRGEFVEGELPNWLLDFVSFISPEPRPWIEQYLAQDTAPDLESKTSALEQGAKAWAEKLPQSMCAISLAFLVSACAEPHAAVRLVEEILKRIEELTTQTSAPGQGLRLMKSLAANALGIMLSGLGRHEEAVQWITIAVEQAEQVGDDDTRDRFRGNLGISLETLGRIDEATRAYEAALASYRTRDDPSLLAFGLISLASHLIRQMRLDEARILAEEGVACAKKAGDERMRGTALSDLGIIAKLKGDYPAAVTLFEEVEKLFTRLGNDEAVAAAAGNRGEVLAALGRFDEAELIQNSVLQTEERLGRRDNQGATCLSLGLLNRQRGDFVAAEAWFKKALAIFRDIKDPSNEGFALYRLASVMMDTRRFAEALETAQTALPMVSDRNPTFTADLWAQVGQASLMLGNVTASEKAYREAIDGFAKLGATRAHASAMMNLGTLLLLQQRDGEAAAAFAESAEFWQGLTEQIDQQNLEYCKLGEAAVRLDERIAALSEAGHASRDLEMGKAAAREMVTLYPDLIAMYEKIGAMQLVAAFCESAASTAEFAGELAHAVDWYRQAASVFQDIGLMGQARNALTRGEKLLQRWANAVMAKGQPAIAVPVLLQLAEVSGQLGDVESCATALLNASIELVQTSPDYAQARGLAKQALELFPVGSDDAAMAQKVIARCNSKLGV